MNFRRALSSLLVISFFILSSCGDEGEPIKEKILEKQIEFAPGGRIEVKNMDGSIHVYGSTLPGVHLQARMRAYSAERLAGLKVEIAQGGGTLSVHSVFPPTRKWGLGDRSGTIDYTLIVPQETTAIDLTLVDGEMSLKDLRGGRTRATLVNGRIGANNCFADVDLRSTNGNIDFYFNWWEQGAWRYRGQIVNGGVGLLVPLGAAVKVRARTAQGGILGSLVKNQSTRGQTLEATLGQNAQATVEIISENGNIRLNHF